MQRGQYIRLFVGTAANNMKAIAAAKDMSLHCSASVEDSSTKDTTGDAVENDVTGLSYDISGSALVLTTDDPLMTGANGLAYLQGLMESRTKLWWRICLVDGDNNRTIDEGICNGVAYLTNVQISAQNRQNTQFSYTLTGYGPLEVQPDAEPAGGTDATSGNL